MDKLKETPTTIAAVSTGKKDKKSDRVEDQNKAMQQRLGSLQMRSSFATMFVMIGMFSFITSQYDGQVIARLPFVPVSFISMLSHRNIKGDDLTECSVYFLYAICSLTFRESIQRFLGVKKAQINPFSALLPDPPKL